MEKLTNTLNCDNSAETSRSNLEAFSNLWTAISNAYEGTNVPRTIARLLQMYQPESGIFVYERLLRTLCVLLENFDANGLRLLASMMPPPTGVPNATIEKVFYEATGSCRLNTPVFRFTNSSDSRVPLAPESSIYCKLVKKDASESSVRKVCNFRCTAPLETAKQLVDQSSLPPKKRKASLLIESQMASAEPNTLREFPSKEISRTRNHAQGTSYFAGLPSRDFSAQVFHNFEQPEKNTDCDLRFIQDPCVVRNKDTSQSPIAYRDFVIKTVDSKYVMLPVVKVYGTSPYNAPHYGLHLQDDRDVERFVGENTATVNVRIENNVQENESKRTPEDALNQCYRADDSEMINLYYQLPSTANMKSVSTTVIGGNVAEKVPNNCNGNSFEKIVPHCCTKECEEKEKMRHIAIQEDIKKMDFVRTDEDDEQEFIFEKQEIEEEDLVIQSNLKRSIQQFLKRIENGETCEAPDMPEVRPLTGTQWSASSSPYWKSVKVTQKSQTCSSENIKFFTETDEKSSAKIKELKQKETEKKSARRKRSEPTNRSKSEKIAQKCVRPKISPKQAKSTKDKSIDVPNASSEYSAVRNDENCMNFVKHRNPIFEMAVYKKQYCDAMLSIQRAKVAVANSLAISSMTNSGICDPYYYSRMQRQYQLLQHQYLLMDPRSTIQRNAFQCRLANNKSNDWKFQSHERCRIPQYTHTVCSTVNTLTHGIVAQNSKMPDVKLQNINYLEQITPNAKNQKL